jgi:hypothetical protein
VSPLIQTIKIIAWFFLNPEFFLVVFPDFQFTAKAEPVVFR